MVALQLALLYYGVVLQLALALVLLLVLDYVPSSMVGLLAVVAFAGCPLGSGCALRPEVSLRGHLVEDVDLFLAAVALLVVLVDPAPVELRTTRGVGTLWP